MKEVFFNIIDVCMIYRIRNQDNYMNNLYSAILYRRIKFGEMYIWQFQRIVNLYYRFGNERDKCFYKCFILPFSTCTKILLDCALLGLH